MKTFKWTMPEPEHAEPGVMGEAEARSWAKARKRGAEWYVVTKGLLFLAVQPLATHLLMAVPLDAALFLEGWLTGLVMGTLVWCSRETRYQRAIDEGVIDDA